MALNVQLRRRHIASVVTYLAAEHPGLDARILTRLATEAVDLVSDCPTPDFVPYLARRVATEAAAYYHHQREATILQFPAPLGPSPSAHDPGACVP